jgi:type 1 glutamine amidotransferase
MCDTIFYSQLDNGGGIMTDSEQRTEMKSAMDWEDERTKRGGDTNEENND